MSYGQYFAFQRRPATGITKTDFFDKLESVGQDLVRNGEDVGRLLGRLGRRDHGERVRGLVVQQSGGKRRKQRRGEGRGGGGQEDELIKVRARLAARVEHGREKRSRLTRGPPQPRRRDASATAHATVLSPTTASAFPNHPLMVSLVLIIPALDEQLYLTTERHQISSTALTGAWKTYQYLSGTA